MDSVKSILSIVIPCKNENYGLIDTLDCLSKQNGIEGVNIIVADCSTDNTRSLVDIYSKLSRLNIVFTEGGLPSTARNNGAKLVNTPYVLFLDADIQIHNPNLISDCLDLCISECYDLVTCKFYTDKPYNYIYRVFDFVQWVSSKTKPFCLGGFMLFKLEAFNTLKGFNEEDKIAEDYHLSSKIKPRRFKVSGNFVYTPSRRFSKKGVWYMIVLAWNAWINRNNDDWFKKDYNYWK